MAILKPMPHVAKQIQICKNSVITEKSRMKQGYRSKTGMLQEEPAEQDTLFPSASFVYLELQKLALGWENWKQASDIYQTFLRTVKQEDTLLSGQLIQNLQLEIRYYIQQLYQNLPDQARTMEQWYNLAVRFLAPAKKELGQDIYIKEIEYIENLWKADSRLTEQQIYKKWTELLPMNQKNQFMTAHREDASNPSHTGQSKNTEIQNSAQSQIRMLVQSEFKKIEHFCNTYETMQRMQESKDIQDIQGIQIPGAEEESFAEQNLEQFFAYMDAGDWMTTLDELMADRDSFGQKTLANQIQAAYEHIPDAWKEQAFTADDMEQSMELQMQILMTRDEFLKNVQASGSIEKYELYKKISQNTKLVELAEHMGIQLGEDETEVQTSEAAGALSYDLALEVTQNEGKQKEAKENDYEKARREFRQSVGAFADERKSDIQHMEYEKLIQYLTDRKQQFIEKFHELEPAEKNIWLNWILEQQTDAESIPELPELPEDIPMSVQIDLFQTRTAFLNEVLNMPEAEQTTLMKLIQQSPALSQQAEHVGIDWNQDFEENMETYLTYLDGREWVQAVNELGKISQDIKSESIRVQLEQVTRDVKAVVRQLSGQAQHTPVDATAFEQELQDMDQRQWMTELGRVMEVKETLSGSAMGQIVEQTYEQMTQIMRKLNFRKNDSEKTGENEPSNVEKPAWTEVEKYLVEVNQILRKEKEWILQEYKKLGEDQQMEWLHSITEENQEVQTDHKISVETFVQYVEQLDHEQWLTMLSQWNRQIDNISSLELRHTIESSVQEMVESVSNLVHSEHHQQFEWSMAESVLMETAKVLEEQKNMFLKEYVQLETEQKQLLSQVLMADLPDLGLQESADIPEASGFQNLDVKTFLNFHEDMWVSVWKRWMEQREFSASSSFGAFVSDTYRQITDQVTTLVYGNEIISDVEQLEQKTELHQMKEMVTWPVIEHYLTETEHILSAQRNLFLANYEKLQPEHRHEWVQELLAVYPENLSGQVTYLENAVNADTFADYMSNLTQQEWMTWLDRWMEYKDTFTDEILNDTLRTVSEQMRSEVTALIHQTRYGISALSGEEQNLLYASENQWLTKLGKEETFRESWAETTVGQIVEQTFEQLSSKIIDLKSEVGILDHPANTVQMTEKLNWTEVERYLVEISKILDEEKELVIQEYQKLSTEQKQEWIYHVAMINQENQTEAGVEAETFSNYLENLDQEQWLNVLDRWIQQKDVYTDVDFNHLLNHISQDIRKNISYLANQNSTEILEWDVVEENLAGIERILSLQKQEFYREVEELNQDQKGTLEKFLTICETDSDDHETEYLKLSWKEIQRYLTTAETLLTEQKEQFYHEYEQLDASQQQEWLEHLHINTENVAEYLMNVDQIQWIGMLKQLTENQKNITIPALKEIIETIYEKTRDKTAEVLYDVYHEKSERSSLAEQSQMVLSESKQTKLTWNTVQQYLLREELPQKEKLLTERIITSQKKQFQREFQYLSPVEQKEWLQNIQTDTKILTDDFAEYLTQQNSEQWLEHLNQWRDRLEQFTSPVLKETVEHAYEQMTDRAKTLIYQTESAKMHESGQDSTELLKELHDLQEDQVHEVLEKQLLQAGKTYDHQRKLSWIEVEKYLSDMEDRQQRQEKQNSLPQQEVQLIDAAMRSEAVNSDQNATSLQTDITRTVELHLTEYMAEALEGTQENQTVLTTLLTTTQELERTQELNHLHSIVIQGQREQSHQESEQENATYETEHVSYETMAYPSMVVTRPQPPSMKNMPTSWNADFSSQLEQKVEEIFKRKNIQTTEHPMNLSYGMDITHMTQNDTVQEWRDKSEKLEKEIQVQKRILEELKEEQMHMNSEQALEKMVNKTCQKLQQELRIERMRRGLR